MNYPVVLALLPMFATALAIAKLICGYMDSMARNPAGDKDNSRKLFVLMGIACIEFMALLCFVIAIILIFKQ